MSHDIQRTILEAQPVLLCSGRTSMSEIATLLGQLLPKVYGYATTSGATMVGPPLVRYTERGQDEVALECGVPVGPGAQPKDDIVLGELPAGPTLSTVHTGPYEGLRDVYGALEAWMKEHGSKPGGAPWEVYLTDPGEVPNPAEWKTQVFWPLAE